MRPIQQLALFVTYLAVLAGCAQGRSAAPPNWVVSAPAPVTVRELAVVGQAPCEGHFVEHQLLFATGVRIREINTYESNGAGLAINDLDKDGDLDLVFASIDREAAILWNEGALHFRSEPLPAQFTRAVA
ncbi:MAG TPA: hypothetical protein PKE45_08725, partial [Caldilineaceae bacterium]|nr:hypothetical protein [Caldilineaceae bacterium]